MSFTNTALAQTTIWSENFESYSDGATAGAGIPAGVSSWSSNSGLAVDVNRGQHTMRGNQVSTSSWITAAIPILKFADVQITMDLAGSGNNLDNSDFLRCEYSYNGTDWTEFYYVNNNLSSTTASINNLNGTSLYIRVTIQNGGKNEYHYIDNVLVQGRLVASPGCTVPVIPSDGQSDIDVDATLNWAPASGASGYYISLGTDAAATNIENAIDLGNVTSYTPSSALSFLTDYYWQVVPYNNYGNATGCSIWSFTTADISYCQAGADTEDEYIARVQIGTINNASGDWSVGGYGDFSSFSTILQQGQKNVALNLDIGNWWDSDDVSAWIDWNNNGSFEASESVVCDNDAQASNVYSFDVPDDATVGTVRMRIRLKYYGNACEVDGACDNKIYGEVEDYSIVILASCNISTYNVTGGGEYCAGDGGVAVGLDDSETGVTYELYLNSSATGNTVSGTGAAISFGNQSTAGTYTVVGTNDIDACEVSMNGSATVTENPVPSAPTIGTVTQPTCTEATGNVVLNGLPSSGTWIVTQNPGSTTTLGTGTSTTITGLAENDYTFTVALINSGNGLSAEYFNNMTLSGTPALTKTDATVGFNWGNGGPGAPIGNDNFSVRWSGKILPLYSENYTFTTNSDDGIRLWVNGTQVINNWTDHAATINTGTIDLSAGQLYDIVLEFYENGGQAVAELSWSSASQTLEIIPQSQLYATGTISTGCPSPSSSTFTINAQPLAPSIITQPSANDESYCLNDPATSLAVIAAGDGLNYQWYSNTSPSTSGGTTVGGDSPSYTPLTTSAGTLYYYVVISGNCAPEVTSSVSGAITVNPLPNTGDIIPD
ncbi:PA14 domain-containing protein [Draconibacterium orientale]|uniref:PA14 domain-containing protein n=1 Tax=Draconibacterium orientale TaxID=1168034 RepID=UPI0029C01508|nr:PA14 domain-containing protein [Draconibacterium orientale]